MQSTTAERRRAEMAEKRAKLAALRKAREDREASLASSRASPATTRPPSTAGDRPASSASRNDEIENLLRGVGVGGGLRESVLGKSTGQASAGTSVSGGEEATVSPSVEADQVATTVKEEAVESSSALSADAATPPPSTPTIASPRPPSPKSEPTTPSLPPPKPKELYDKGIQTSDFSFSAREPSTSADVHAEAGGVGRESSDELRARIIAELEEERKQLDAEIAEEKRRAEVELEEERRRGLNEPELASVLASSTFLDFLDSSTKVVQRALSDSYDYLRDYTISAADEGADADGARVRLLGTWQDVQVGRGRSVTDVDWSSKFPELFVASYGRNDSPNDPKGLACVWNLHLRERPEFVFHANSDVLSVRFSPYNPNYVFGGTYTGQVLLWDTRNRHPNPALASPLSAVGHTHPIYSLDLVGSTHAHNLVSASTDGTVCSWATDGKFREPASTLDLLHPMNSKTDDVSVTAMGFPQGENNTFWVGTEEGKVYAALREAAGGRKAGLLQNEMYQGHNGPVTGLDFHPVAGAVDLSDLFLTCGVDWTVRLWQKGTGGASAVSVGGGSAGGGASAAAASSKSTQIKHEPLITFEEADDYIYDVKWHPHHPALFGSVDGAGNFNLWNMNEDTEVPLLSTTVGSRGLNKLAWDRKEGRRAAIGSSDGKVYVYEISQDLATPPENAWEEMRRTCNAALSGESELGGY